MQGSGPATGVDGRERPLVVGGQRHRDITGAPHEGGLRDPAPQQPDPESSVGLPPCVAPAVRVGPVLVFEADGEPASTRHD
ncbi:hypothetical protein ACWGI1_19550, partial [Streptomyces sp. NPDC054835]